MLTEDEAIDALKNMSNIWKHSQVLAQADFVSFEFYLIKDPRNSRLSFKFSLEKNWLPTPFYEGNKRKSQMNEAFGG